LNCYYEYGSGNLYQKIIAIRKEEFFKGFSKEMSAEDKKEKIPRG